MIDTRLLPIEMTPAERHEFCRKAEADRLTFESAEALAERQPEPAAALARDAVALVGAERVSWWLRHYAVTRFDVARAAVDALLRRSLPGTLAA